MAGRRPGAGRAARWASPSASTTWCCARCPPRRPAACASASTCPRGARLHARLRHPAEHHGEPGVEFVVKVARGGREETVWTQLLDPLSNRRTPALGARRRGPRALRRPRRRADPGDARLRARRRPAPRVLGHARAHRGRRRTRRWPSSTWWTRCAPTTPALRLRRATPRPSWCAFARRRGRVRAGDRPRVLDQALGGLALHLAAPRPPPRRPAARPARPRPGHAGGDAAGQGLRHRRRRRQLGHLRPRARTSSRASTTSPACTARATGPRSWWRRRAWWTRRCAWLDARRGFPTLPLRPHHGPARALHAARRPSTASTRRTRRPDHPAADPAQRLQGADRPRAPDRPVRRRHRLRRPRVRPLRARAEGARPLRPARSSSSWPTTARSSWTTASGCTARACSTS